MGKIKVLCIIEEKYNDEEYISPSVCFFLAEDGKMSLPKLASLARTPYCFARLSYNVPGVSRRSHNPNVELIHTSNPVKICVQFRSKLANRCFTSFFDDLCILVTARFFISSMVDLDESSRLKIAD